MRRSPPFQANRTPNTTLDHDLDARFRALEDHAVDLGRFLGTLLGQVTPVASTVVEGDGTSDGGTGGGGGPGTGLDPGTIDGQVLRWNDAGQVWEPAEGIIVSEDGDVSIQTPVGPQVMQGPVSAGGAWTDMEAFGLSPNAGIRSRMARGTRAAPTGCVADVSIMRLWADGYGSGGYNEDVASIEFYARQNFDGSIGSTYALVKVAPLGSKIKQTALAIYAEYVEAIGHFVAGTDTPSQITSNQNNYALGNGRYQRLSTDVSRTITGFLATVSGDERAVVNVGSNPLVITNEDAASTAANRVITGTGVSISLNANESILMWYDSASSRWRVL